MNSHAKWMASLLGACLCLAGLSRAHAAEPRKKHEVPRSPDGDLVVGLCDGETSVEVNGVKEGQGLSREQALEVTAKLMADWQRKNPEARWDPPPPPSARPTLVAQKDPPSPRSPTQIDPAQKKPTGQQPVAPSGPSAASGGAEVRKHGGAHVQSGHTYGAFGPRDEAIWKASTQTLVEQGNRVFHDAKELGSPIAVSCDMCHPDASNTHPETYPKFQVQLGRVALLRDMINWCIENPVRGKPLSDEDPKMKAMEAYIFAKRKGVALEYGKH